MLLSFATLAHARTNSFICMNAAAEAALAVNNTAMDPEITPPAVRAQIEKEFVINQVYLILLDNGMRYEVVTVLQPEGSCKAINVDGL